MINRSVIGKYSAIGLLFLFLLPNFAMAAKIPYWGPILSCTGSDTSKNEAIPGGVTKHCDSICDLLVTAQNLLAFAITLALFAIAPLIFMWGAIQIMTAGGDSEKVSSGRKTIYSGVMGIIIIFLAYVIVNSFFFFVSKLFNTDLNGISNWSSIQCK